MISLSALLVLALAGCGQPALDRRTSGDPRAGRAVFRFAGCATCHAISGIAVGEGGPGLDAEGNRRAAPWLRRMLPGHMKAVGASAWPRRDVEDLVAYLVSLR
ncbi:MAG TPA: cytochrome c [Chloroflexota bacterium]|nr:cytochrome c [Chloroflexota bacterium]